MRISKILGFSPGIFYALLPLIGMEQKGDFKNGKTLFYI